MLDMIKSFLAPMLGFDRNEGKKHTLTHATPVNTILRHEMLSQSFEEATTEKGYQIGDIALKVMRSISWPALTQECPAEPQINPNGLTFAQAVMTRLRSSLSSCSWPHLSELAAGTNLNKPAMSYVDALEKPHEPEEPKLDTVKLKEVQHYYELMMSIVGLTGRRAGEDYRRAQAKASQISAKNSTSAESKKDHVSKKSKNKKSKKKRNKVAEEHTQKKQTRASVVEECKILSPTESNALKRRYSSISSASEQTAEIGTATPAATWSDSEESVIMNPLEMNHVAASKNHQQQVDSARLVGIIVQQEDVTEASSQEQSEIVEIQESAQYTSSKHQNQSQKPSIEHRTESGEPIQATSSIETTVEQESISVETEAEDKKSPQTEQSVETIDILKFESEYQTNNEESKLAKIIPIIKSLVISHAPIFIMSIAFHLICI